MEERKYKKKKYRPRDPAKPREYKPRGFQMPEPQEGSVTITAIKAQQKRADRCSIFFDDKYWAASPLQVMIDESLSVGKVLNPDQQQKLAETIARQDACQKALDILAQRNVSSGQLRQALKRRRYPQEAVEAAEQFIADRELINDEYWAEACVRDSIRAQRSRRQTDERLQKAGIEEDLREQALEQYDELVEQEIIESLVQNSNVPADKLRKRLINKGFNWEIVNAVLVEHAAGRPAEEAPTREKAPLDLERLRRDVRKRYARASEDFAVKRKALAWLGRRGVYGEQAYELLQDEE